MTIATLYRANGEAVPLPEPDYTVTRPGIAHGSSQPQITLRHIAELIGTTPNHVEFCESRNGQRIAYGDDEFNQPANPFAATSCILPLRGSVVEVPYENSLDY